MRGVLLSALILSATPAQADLFGQEKREILRDIRDELSQIRSEMVYLRGYLQGREEATPAPSPVRPTPYIAYQMPPITGPQYSIPTPKPPQYSVPPPSPPQYEVPQPKPPQYEIPTPGPPGYEVPKPGGPILEIPIVPQPPATPPLTPVTPSEPSTPAPLQPPAPPDMNIPVPTEGQLRRFQIMPTYYPVYHQPCQHQWIANPNWQPVRSNR